MGRHNKRTQSASSSDSEDELVALLMKAKKKLKKTQKKKMKKERSRHSGHEDSACLEGCSSPSTSINLGEPLDIGEDYKRVVEIPAVASSVIPANSGQTEENAASLLPPEVLVALGEDTPTCKSVGPPLPEELAERWITTLQGGLDVVQRESLSDKYPLPPNCMALGAPVLNAEVRQVLCGSACNRDERLASRQRQIGAALAAIGSTITNLLVTEGREGHDLDNIARLGDAGRLLADLHYTLSDGRRSLITVMNNINKEYESTLMAAPIGASLFGDDLTQRLLSLKQLEESSGILNPPPSSRNQRPSTSRNVEPLTYRRPPLNKPRGYKEGRSTERSQTNTPVRQFKSSRCESADRRDSLWTTSGRPHHHNK